MSPKLELSLKSEEQKMYERLKLFPSPYLGLSLKYFVRKDNEKRVKVSVP